MSLEVGSRLGHYDVTRKHALPLYIMSGFAGHDALLEKLGKFKTGKSCLYIKRLDDVDLKVLTELISRAVEKGGQMGALPAGSGALGCRRRCGRGWVEGGDMKRRDLLLIGGTRRDPKARRRRVLMVCGGLVAGWMQDSVLRIGLSGGDQTASPSGTRRGSSSVFPTMASR